MANMAMCPECEVLISVPGPLRLRKRLECPECGAELEVISLRPLQLDFLYDEDENEWEEEELDEFDEDDLWAEEEEDEDLEDEFDEE